MQTFSKSKKFSPFCLLLLLLACYSNPSKEKTAAKNSTDTMAPPPKVGISNNLRKCFANDGLKYKTVVTLLFIKKNGEDIVSGNVTSEELGSGKKERGVFEGAINGDKLMTKFVGNPPTIGDASEWTDKSWTIKKEDGKETLLIVFNAKNYDTNKWEDTDYKFVMVDCK